MPAPLVKIVPNALSSLRLILALLFPVLPAEWRLPVMLLGAFSDWIDGLIARRYHAITALGTMLDAIADKLFTLSVLLTIILSARDGATWWQGVIVLSRDLAVSMIAAYALCIGRLDAFSHMKPRLAGKLTTTTVFIWLVTVLAGAPLNVRWMLFAIAGACSVVAGVDYLSQFLRRWSQLQEKTNQSV